MFYLYNRLAAINTILTVIALVLAAGCPKKTDPSQFSDNDRDWESKKEFDQLIGPVSIEKIKALPKKVTEWKQCHQSPLPSDVVRQYVDRCIPNGNTYPMFHEFCKLLCVLEDSKTSQEAKDQAVQTYQKAIDQEDNNAYIENVILPIRNNRADILLCEELVAYIQFVAFLFDKEHLQCSAYLLKKRHFRLRSREEEDRNSGKDLWQEALQLSVIAKQCNQESATTISTGIALMDAWAKEQYAVKLGELGTQVPKAYQALSRLLGNIQADNEILKKLKQYAGIMKNTVEDLQGNRFCFPLS